MSANEARTGIGRYVSVLDGIRPYQKAWLTKDVVAGITLAALAIPETMGYTKIAGMPVITGLYTILIPIAAFALLGSSKHLVVGADSATAAIMYAGIAVARHRRARAGHAAVGRARRALARCWPAGCCSWRGLRGSASCRTSSRAPC